MRPLLAGAQARSQHRACAFTLVEVMVSLAVVAVLTAITLPVFTRARETARRTTCLSNLRQIGLAFAIYMDDWDGAFPNTGDPYLWMGRRWRWALNGYLGERLERDPSRPDDPLRSSHTPSFLICPSDPYARDQWDATSYGYSKAFYHAPGQIAAMTTEDLWEYDRFPCVTQRESSVAFPARKALVAEWLTNHDTQKLDWWHWGGARNYLFVDGHALHLPTARIHPAVTGLPDPNLTAGGITGRDVD